jgi:hypothetical protein
MHDIAIPVLEAVLIAHGAADEISGNTIRACRTRRLAGHGTIAIHPAVLEIIAHEETGITIAGNKAVISACPAVVAIASCRAFCDQI